MAELCREDLASNKVDEHARTMASMGIGLDPLDPLGADGEPEPEPVEVSVLRRSARRSVAPLICTRGAYSSSLAARCCPQPSEPPPLQDAELDARITPQHMIEMATYLDVDFATEPHLIPLIYEAVREYTAHTKRERASSSSVRMTCAAGALCLLV